MKHKLSFIVALWWLIFCAVAGFFVVLLAEKQSHPSESENRMLAGFPGLNLSSVVSGDFMEGFEAFLSDGFFARDEAIDAAEGIMDAFNVLSADERMAIETAEMERRLASEAVSTARPDAGEAIETDVPAPEAEAVAADLPVAEEEAREAQGVSLEAMLPADEPMLSGADAADEPDSQAAALDETDDEGEETVMQAGAIPLTAENSYLWYDMPDGSYTVNYTYENDKIAVYAETLRRMQRYLPADGVICFTQVPLSSMARRWTSQRESYVGWGSSVETVLENCLEGTERIYVFSTYDILEPYMQKTSRLFYHTDHHWSAEGAYLVFAEMMKRQNVPVIPYDEYEYKANPGKKTRTGNYDTFNVLYPLLPGHSYVIRHVDEATEIDLMNYKTGSYLAFMNSTQLPWRRVVTGANTGRKALVICDSFGNAFTPYLLPYYDEVHMCDFRYDRFDKDEVGGSIGFMLSYYRIDDVYIITSTANGLRKENSIKFLRKFLED